MSSDDIRESFLTEFDEFFDTIKSEFNKAKQGKPTNNAEVFRAFHTWKGNAALLSYSEFEKFAVKWTEVFRPKKNEKSLNEKPAVLDGIVKDLEKFRKTF